MNLHCIIPLLIIGIITFILMKYQIAFQQGNWKCTHVPHPWLAGFSEVFCDEYTKIDLLNK
jgi:hypothetical protein